MRVYIALILTLLGWASSFVAIRAALVSFSPGGMALLRYLIASAVLLVVYLRLPNRQKVTLKELPRILIIGVIGIGIYNIALNTGEVHVSAGVAGFVIGLVPVITVILAALFLKERIHLKTSICVLISVLGVFLIALSNHNVKYANIGLSEVLLAALCGATFTVLQKPLLKKYSPLEMGCFIIWGGCLFLLFFAGPMIHDLKHASSASIWWVVFLGVGPAAISYTAWSYTVAHMPVQRATMFLFCMPFITVFLGWLILNEIPNALAIVGCLVALSGVVLLRVRFPKLLALVKS